MCLDAGMDNYVSKPVVKKDLHVALEKHIDEKSEFDAEARLPQPSSIETKEVFSQDSSAADGGEPVVDAEQSESLPVDLTCIRSLADSDDVILKDLINLFLTDTEEHGKLLRTAIEQSSASEIRSEAHRIKGGAVQIGAESLGALAAVLENAGRENALMDTKAQLVDFEQEYSRVREFLELEIQS